MAVKINLGGNIGEVTADNAASESTLLDILAALDGRSSSAKSHIKDEKDRAKAQKEGTKIQKDASKMQKEFSVAWSAAGDQAIKGLKTIGLTAISMATRFAVDYADIAKNPIMSTAKTLDQMIDVTGKVVGGLASAIPIVGEFAKAAVDATAEIAKVGNKMFSEQLQKNIEAMQTYNKVGISFAGGMTEMNTVAHSAGLGISEFSKVVADNKQELNLLGLAGGSAAAKLGTAMAFAANDVTTSGALIGKSGKNLRSELFKMGYTYEEQGGIFTSFMANMQVAGKLRTMSDKEIAVGAREYAKNLKVISDFTGLDAKKLADKARQEMLAADLQQKLSANELTQTQQAFTMLEGLGVGANDAKIALTQLLTEGTTNIVAYTSGPMRDMLDAVIRDIYSGNKVITENTGAAMTVAAKEMLALDKVGATARNRTFGIQGAASDSINTAMQGVAAYSLKQKDTAIATAKATEDQANKANKLGDATADMYSTTKSFAVLLETKVNTSLDAYAITLEKVNAATLGILGKFLKSGADEEKAQKRKQNHEAAMSAGQSNSFNPWGKGVPAMQGFKFDNVEAGIAAGFMPKYTNKKLTGWKYGDETFKAYANGGSIPAGKVGMAGEKGPELIAGPAEVLSTKSTEKLMQSVDMLAAAKESASTTKDGVSVARLDEVIKQLMELVRLMRDNVSHTAKVAQNTN